MPGVFPKFANAKSHSVSTSRLSSLSDLVVIATPLWPSRFWKAQSLEEKTFSPALGRAFFLVTAQCKLCKEDFFVVLH